MSMTIVVMAIAISLASGFYLLIANVQQLTRSIESSNQISLFLKSSVGDRAGEQLADEIRKTPVATSDFYFKGAGTQRI